MRPVQTLAIDDIVTRLSRLSEGLVLDYFWQMNSHHEDRTKLLEQLSTVRLQRPATWSARTIRVEFEAAGSPGRAFSPHLTLSRNGCFRCRARRRQLYWHHLIEVHHGGSNNPRNFVALCFSCHQHLHPWLKEELPGRRRAAGLERLTDIAPEAVAGATGMNVEEL